MGGPGSGNWYRWNKKTYTEEVNRIDIRYMKKQGMLQPGYSGSLSWSCRGEPSGNIRYQMWDDSMILIYKYRGNGGDWESVQDTVSLDETPCHYGGVRKWFICPSCSKRVGLLYGPGKYFRCRTCYGLSYSSQSEGQLDRLSRKARKIRHKLDIDNPIFDPDNLSDGICFKPKGMHQKTFDRLRSKESRLQNAINNAFVSRFGFYM